jgi:hypothetical protein
MKYIEIVSRNVYFTPNAQQVLDLFRKKLVNENGKHWLDTVFRRYIINDYPYARKLTKRELTGKEPEWVVKALNENKEVIVPMFSSYVSDLEHWMDYINTLPPNKDLTRLSIPQLQKQVVEWDLSFKKSGGNTSGVVIKTYPTGFKWVELNTEEGLRYEGSNMNHCVENYYDYVQQGMTKIYSLRDSNNKPHTTIEVTDNSLRQVKGKNNKAPNSKYLPYILDALNEGVFPFDDYNCQDLRMLPVIAIDDVYYDIDKLPKKFKSNIISADDFAKLNEIKKYIPGLVVNDPIAILSRTIIIPEKTVIKDLFCENCTTTINNATVGMLKIFGGSVTSNKSKINTSMINKCNVQGTITDGEGLIFHNSILQATVTSDMLSFEECKIYNSHIKSSSVTLNNCEINSLTEFKCDTLVISKKCKILNNTKPVKLKELKLYDIEVTLPPNTQIKELKLVRSKILNIQELKIEKLNGRSL